MVVVKVKKLKAQIKNNCLGETRKKINYLKSNLNVDNLKKIIRNL